MDGHLISMNLDGGDAYVAADDLRSRTLRVRTASWDRCLYCAIVPARRGRIDRGNKSDSDLPA
jgi:hypothetical protein